MSRYSFAHLLDLSTPIGTFEHAAFAAPRPEHGYCTDDMARLLVVATRELRPTAPVRQLAMTACRFLASGQDPTGRTRNRCDAAGRWRGRYGVDDCWGRSQWGFGTASRRSGDDTLRQMSLAYYGHGVQQRSTWPRAMAFAALGAAEVLAVDPHHSPSLRLLADTATVIGRPPAGAAWPWPEPRLTYANAVLPEALLIAGDRLGRAELVDDGLRMLRWLLDRQIRDDGHLSPTPAAGEGPDGRRHDATGPGADQQPIEVAALADACRRAFDLSGDRAWLQGVDAAVRWFQGDNDIGQPMWDPATGGGYDGLQAGGVNQNQGAESTLALLSTLQLAAELDRLTPSSGR